MTLNKFFNYFKADIRSRALELSDFQTKKRFFINVSTGIIISLIFAWVFGFVTGLKTGGMELYGTIVIPMVVISVLIVLFTSFYNSSMGFTLLCLFYIYFGIALQILIKLPAEDPSASDLIFQAALAIIAAFVAVPLIDFVAKNRKFFIYALTALSCLVYMLLLVVGRRNAGSADLETRAWVNIGGTSLQLTEFTKVFFLIVVALILSAKKASDKRKIISITIVFLIHVGGLFLINEFGTLIIMFICYFIACLVYMTKTRGLWITIVMFVAIACAGIIATNVCYKAKYGKEDTRSNIFTMFQAEVETDEAEQVPDAEEDEANEPQEIEKKGFIVENGAKIYQKFYDRIAMMIHPERFENSDVSYQRKQADKALEYSGAFGKEYGVIVPVIKTDFIYLYVLMKMGAVIGVLTILGLGVMYISTAPQILKKNKSAQGHIAFILLTMLVVQSLLNASSAIGIIPTIGVVFSFLSSGGTANMINYTAMIFIIYALRQNAGAPLKAAVTETASQAQEENTKEDDHVS